MKKPLIILTGPTAVGKTELSIKLAKAVNGEIISADSMQVYKEMDIGTAKIKEEEMEGIPHYLINQFMPDEEFNVVTFQQHANKAIADIHSRGKIPVIVGGTGFYIQALLYNIDFSKDENDYSYRHELEQMAEERGIEFLHDMLKEVDPISADAIHANNRKRVIRALEYFHLTGMKISEHNEEQHAKQSPYQFAYFVLAMDRKKLYERIDLRVDQMIENGLLEEVKALKEKGYHKDMVSMQGIGYKEIFDFLEGHITLEESIRILKRDTRHFAKRQLTWFKRERDVTMVQKDLYETEDEVLEHILHVLDEDGGIYERNEADV